MPKGVPIAQPRSRLDINQITMGIIRRYQPEVLTEPMPFDIERFFECDLEALTGVEAVYGDLPIEIHGYTDSEELQASVSKLLVDDPSKFAFLRSTIAHEVGHAVMHVPEFRRRKDRIRLIHNKENVSLRLYREEEIVTYKNPEWQAWWFAKSLLMPGVTVRKAVESGYDEYDLARVYQVNRAFVRRRLKDLGISL